MLGLPLLLLAGIGPVVAWRRASLRGVVQAFRWPFVSALAAGALLVLLGYALQRGRRRRAQPLPVRRRHDRARARARDAARRALTPGISWPAALAQLVGRNRRRYGGYVVHLAVVIGVVAIVGTSAYATSRTLVLAPGQTRAVPRLRPASCAASSRRSRAATSRPRPSSTSTRAASASTRCARRRARISTRASRPSRSRSARCCAPARISTSSSTARRGPAWRHDQGLPESARQPALALRDRPRARLRHRHLARSAPRGAARAAHERGVRARSLMLIAVIVLLVLAVGVVALVAWPLVRERTVEMSAPGCAAPRAARAPRRRAAGPAGARARPPGGQAHRRGRRARAPDAARRGRRGARGARSARARALRPRA